MLVDEEACGNNKAQHNQGNFAPSYTRHGNIRRESLCPLELEWPLTWLGRIIEAIICVMWNRVAQDLMGKVILMYTYPLTTTTNPPHARVSQLTGTTSPKNSLVLVTNHHELSHESLQYLYGIFRVYITQATPHRGRCNSILHHTQIHTNIHRQNRLNRCRPNQQQLQYRVVLPSAGPA